MGPHGRPVDDGTGTRAEPWLYRPPLRQMLASGGPVSIDDLVAATAHSVTEEREILGDMADLERRDSLASTALTPPEPAAEGAATAGSRCCRGARGVATARGCQWTGWRDRRSPLAGGLGPPRR